MSRIRTFLASILVAGATTSPGQSSTDLAHVFAECAGRFSAELEHAWLLQDAHADEFHDRLRTFASLIEATVADGSQRDILNYRIETKLAHSALLTTASFSADIGRAKTAREMANGYLLGCNHLLLDS